MKPEQDIVRGSMSGGTYGHILGARSPGPKDQVKPRGRSESEEELWALATAWTSVLRTSYRHQCAFHLALDCNLCFQKVKCLVRASVATQTAKRSGSMSSPGIVWAQASDAFPSRFSPGRFQVGTWKTTMFPGYLRS